MSDDDELVDFASAPLTAIIAFVRERLDEGETRVELLVAETDLGAGRYAGETVEVGDEALLHRPFRTWVDLAERMNLRLHTPRSAPGGRLRLRFDALDPEARWERGTRDDPTEKYGLGSGYQRIRKAEDPSFVIDLADALERTPLPSHPTILDLGVNDGDELALLLALRPDLREATFVGIDHSASAIARARERFEGARHRFIEADLATLPELELPPFDLVLSIGTLQSPGVDDRELLRHIVQRRLTPRGSLILGTPNCRYLDGEVLYGARMKNFRQPDLSLLVKTVAFQRRYLQQHRRRVFVTGKHYVLVTAVPEGRSRDRDLIGRDPGI